MSGYKEDALLIVNDIKDERLKGLAYVSLAKLFLSKNSVIAQNKVIRVGEDGIRKSAIKVVMPAYPSASLRSKAKGVAVAELQFNSEGIVSAVKILESPDSYCSQSVANALQQWRLKPSQLEGEPISVRGKVTFYFSLNSKGRGEVKNPKQFQ